jgi:hypothetical protein
LGVDHERIGALPRVGAGFSQLQGRPGRRVGRLGDGSRKIFWNVLKDECDTTGYKGRVEFLVEMDGELIDGSLPWPDVTHLDESEGSFAFG